MKFNWDTEAALRRDRRAFPAATYPDEWIIRGNHHDAWVNGARRSRLRARSPRWRRRARSASCSSRAGSRSAPSFIAPGMARSRACSARPNGRRRMPRSCSATARSYINSDGNGRGYLQVEGSHTLEKFINGVAKDIDDPETKHVGLEAHASLRCECAEAAVGGANASAGRAGPAHRRAGLRLRLHGVSRSSGHGVAEYGLRRRR